MQKEGIHGEEVYLRSKTDFIWSDKNGLITKNGEHVGIRVGDTIFDNLNPSGVPLKTWMNDLGVGHPGMYPPIFNPF